ncbi:MAG: hypothetical protein IJ174_08725 [Clostridia bacterium]|nr:hypothetical protein [Clostridia bacterium]
MKTEMELNLEELEMANGGTVNKNPTPGNVGIDLIINGKNYDALAQAIANILNGDNVRTRNVQQRDIYDCKI